MTGFSSYLIYGLCAAGILGGGGYGIAIAFSNKKVENPTEKKLERKEEVLIPPAKKKEAVLIGEYVVRSEGSDKCGTLTETEEDSIENKNVSCESLKGDHWYKKEANKNFSLSVRVDENKASKISNSITGFSLGNYAKPNLRGISESWKTQDNSYSCVSSYDSENRNQKVIINCMKVG